MKRIVLLILVGTIAAGGARSLADDMPAGKFMAPAGRSGVILELRSEATVHGADVKLKQLCRWAESDAAYFAPMADLTIAHCKPGATFQSVSLEQIRQTLSEAGVNIAMLHFAGPTSCTIGRSDIANSDIANNEQSALQQWIDAKQGKASAIPAGEAPIPQPVQAAAVVAGTPGPAIAQKPATPTSDPKLQTLRELLAADGAARLGLPLEMLQVTFSPADEKILALSGPLFKFNIDSRQIYNLGDIAWDVQIITDGNSKKVRVAATATAWQNELVLTKPVSAKQVLRDSDLTEQKTRVWRLADEPLVTREQAVGQQASRDLKPGTILTARMIDPVQLVSIGQLVSLTLQQGGVQIKTVARALEAGSYGQIIRVKNEATGDVYQPLITGPQEGSLSPSPRGSGGGAVADIGR